MTSKTPNETDPNKAFFFPDLDEINKERTPPEETRILELSAKPYPDARRVRVELEMSPFLVRPHLDLIILDPQGAEAATASIIEPMTWKQVFTVHLRTEKQIGEYTLHLRLFYPPRDEEDPKLFRLDIPVEDTDRKELKLELPTSEE
ncbi:MAG: hypothetical protein HN392_10175 [Anaerolineae bacterium]|jgi:hypothetical protein|nr:hypothetical protein [Anaerolineae bacterium]MBT7074329.1 hypothetical protein [Anaerolineae bacterium]MBT7781927.1 hypothetical protein [Anaerolineae bacterium]